MLNSRFFIYAGLCSVVCLISNDARAQSSAKPTAPQTATTSEMVPSQGSAMKQGSDTKVAVEEGFEPLLTSNDLSMFRGYKKEKITPGWTVTDEVLHIDGVKRGDDIITKKSYKNFDMRFEWKVADAGNSGVFYHVGMGDKAASKSGIEYQVLDDEGHHDGKNPLTSAGSIYALYPPKTYPKKAVGQWNEGRIVVDGPKITHYLNGVEVAEADTSSDDWKQRLAASKFSTWEKFASQSQGPIALQDHGDEAWFKNIRIKELPESEATPAGSGSKAAGSEMMPAAGSGAKPAGSGSKPAGSGSH